MPKYGIKTISDMVALANQLTMIGTPEFEAREDGLPVLKKSMVTLNSKVHSGDRA